MAKPHVVDERVVDLVRALLGGSTGRLKPYHPAVVKSLAYLADHFQDEICLQDLAVHVHVSRSSLCRLFQVEIGMSPMQFLALFRVEKSKLVLADRQGSVKEAWGDSGFGDLRTLEREFKKWVGCTPIEYRQKAVEQRKGSPIQDE